MSKTGPMHSEPPKVDPETLVLRANPRRVVRFKRKLLMAIAATLCIAVFGATWLALGQGPITSVPGNHELYNVERKTTAEGLATLPANYAQVSQPRLGPPLAGDVGPAVLEQERNLGLTSTETSLRPDPEEDMARAERLRLAQQAQQASEAGVFFQLSQGSAANASVAPAASANGPSAAYVGGDRLTLDPVRDQNYQQRKLDFLNQEVDASIYNPHSVQDPVSPYQVLAGTILSASLITGLNSDLPGLVVAQVTENVYDTVTGRILLIPQGARLIGSYDSIIAFGQSRALLVWQRIIMPDGSSIQIENLPATDAAGYAGLEDEVDYHTWSLLKGVALSTILGVGTELTLGNTESDLVRALRQSTQLSVNQAGQRITERNLNIQPTITVRPGWPLRVVVHKDLVLRPYRG